MLSIELYCFFFKQKTAYEMRISDWSSDVCSSDLIERRRVRFYRLCGTAGCADARTRDGIETTRTFACRSEIGINEVDRQYRSKNEIIHQFNNCLTFARHMLSDVLTTFLLHYMKIPLTKIQKGNGMTWVTVSKVLRSSEERRVGKECFSTVNIRE